MEWISIKHVLPEIGQRVLCFNGYIHVKEAYEMDGELFFYDGDNHWTGSAMGQLENVTHWMPLPKPPVTNASTVCEGRI